MKQRFFTTTLKSNFIKALIYNTPIPIIGSVNDNSYILKDNIYIYQNNIIKCTNSGIIKMPEFDSSEYTAYYCNGDIKIIPVNDATNKYDDILSNYVELSSGSFKVIDLYKFGRYYPKFTELYYSKYGYYDTETHKHLGDLLRLYRDIFGINLMPYYNCVSGDFISGIVINRDSISQESSDDYKTFKVPIKFNTNYTLAIDSSGEVRTVPILLSDDYIIDNISYYSSSGGTFRFNPNEDIVKNITSFSSMSFKHPEVIGVNTLTKDNASIIQKYEKYLYLLIQVPKSNNSSIVLLEGDYTNVHSNNIYSVEDIESLSDLELSNIMTSDLSLLQMSDGVTYPFADRLIEYLLLNVITTRDPITKNIKRIQDVFTNYTGVPEVWDNNVRSNVYLEFQKSDLIEHLDLNGFVDIDTERLIKKLS